MSISTASHSALSAPGPAELGIVRPKLPSRTSARDNSGGKRPISFDALVFASRSEWRRNPIVALPKP